MFIDKRSWQELQAETDKFRKLCTCPVCGKQIKEWTCFRTPMHGMIACGQWYCSRKHWAADPNSSFYKNPRYSRMVRLYLRFEQLRKKKMHNQPEIRYSESLYEQKWQNARYIAAYLFEYLEHLADIQAGITLTVDRLMVIPYDYQIVSPSRRTYDEVAVKPGTYRLRAFRENRGQRDECHRMFDFDRRFVLDMHRTGILGNPIPYDVWFRNSQCLEHILKEHLIGSIEIVEDRRFPGTVRKLTFTHSNVAENRTGGSNN